MILFPPGTLRTWVLGSDTRQQLRASQSLLVLTVYLAFALVQHAEVLLGMMDAAQSWYLTTWNLSGGLLFFALIRSGLNLRLSRADDPALALPQSGWAMTGIAWSYAITGPARGAVILIMLLVLIFGTFQLKPLQARALVGLGFLMLAAVMLFKALTDPARYDPRVEGMHLLFAGIVMAAVSALAIRIGKLRQRLQDRGHELATALQRIQALATHDELTGLTNRRAALERMQQVLAVRLAPGARGLPLLGLALLDIDFFKRVNDELGHAAGDEVLRRFSKAGSAVVREGDLLARWGGEEFLLVMPACNGATVEDALQRLRQCLQADSLADVAPGLAVTFSAGVAECHEAGDLEAAIARADAAMYSAKRGGRDRVVLATDERRAGTS